MSAELTTLMDSAEAAVYIRMSKQTLAKWRHIGFGPSYVKLGRSVFYKKSDLDAFVSSKMVDTASKV